VTGGIALLGFCTLSSQVCVASSSRVVCNNLRRWLSQLFASCGPDEHLARVSEHGNWRRRVDCQKDHIWKGTLGVIYWNVNGYNPPNNYGCRGYLQVFSPFSGNYEVVSARFKPGETLVLVYLTQLRQKDMKVTSNVHT